MTRQLRSRASRPNYAALLGIGEDENGAGPSGATHELDDDSSGSDFALEAGAEEAVEEDVDDMVIDDAEAEPEDDAPARKRKRPAPSTREPSVLDYGSASVTSRAKKTPAKATPRRSVAFIPGLALSSNRQAPGLPSLHHRHRSTGVYLKEGKIERLAEAPALFLPEITTPTNAWSANDAVSNRVNKSWGYNIGPGPLWELAEDRGWYKEAGTTSGTSERELRPRVHEYVVLRPYEHISPQ